MFVGVKSNGAIYFWFGRLPAECENSKLGGEGFTNIRCTLPDWFFVALQTCQKYGRYIISNNYLKVIHEIKII